MLPIYLDYAATTPVDPQVANLMMTYLNTLNSFGNPNSTHIFGEIGKAAIVSARAKVAALLNASAHEIIWTSGATEANNLALKGVVNMYRDRGNHIVTLSSEHKSILDTCQYLVKQGIQVTFLKPQSNGLLNLAAFADALRQDTILASIMWVNNELGTIQDLHSIANITSQKGILLHVDAAQAAGKVVIDMQKIPIDLVSLCAHKVYGPKGIGALYLRGKPRVRVAPQLHGGGQEQGLRAGTLATHQIVGMGEAFAIAQHRMVTENNQIEQLRNYFLTQLAGLNYTIHGDQLNTVPHILNLRFAEIPAQLILNQLPTVALSRGSACQDQDSSHVLRALGLNIKQAQAAIRIAFGRFTTLQEVESVAINLKKIVNKLQG